MAAAREAGAEPIGELAGLFHAGAGRLFQDPLHLYCKDLPCSRAWAFKRSRVSGLKLRTRICAMTSASEGMIALC